MKITEMSVELIDKMGTDLSVVNAARVSFSKKSELEQDSSKNGVVLNEKDSKLIKYLAVHDHFTPFCHAFLSLRIKAPIFVARQLVKHQVGLSWNEESRRYIDEEPEFWFPKEWRARPEGNIKQGSGETIKEWLPDHLLRESVVKALDNYNQLLLNNIAPEMARMVLPLNTMTNWIWSGSLLAFIRVCQLRCDPHAQKETQEIGMKIKNMLLEHFPVSAEAHL